MSRDNETAAEKEARLALLLKRIMCHHVFLDGVCQCGMVRYDTDPTTIFDRATPWDVHNPDRRR